MRAKRQGFTLVELLVSIGLASLVASAVFLLMQSGVSGSFRLTERASAEQDVRLRLQAMSQEIEEGTRLFFPRTGEGPRDGVGFVNERGEPIFYYLARFGGSGEDGRAALRRACLSVKDSSDQIVLEGVLHFRATTARVAAGRMPGVVNLDLAVGSRLAGIDANGVTSVFLRALDRRSGDEPEPAPSKEEPR